MNLLNIINKKLFTEEEAAGQPPRREPGMIENFLRNAWSPSREQGALARPPNSQGNMHKKAYRTGPVIANIPS